MLGKSKSNLTTNLSNCKNVDAVVSDSIPTSSLSAQVIAMQSSLDKYTTQYGSVKIVYGIQSSKGLIYLNNYMN